MSPTLAKFPPTGPEWIHEVKFDGWRVQVHVDDGEAAIYSKMISPTSERSASDTEMIFKPGSEVSPIRAIMFASFDCTKKSKAVVQTERIAKETVSLDKEALYSDFPLASCV